MIYPQNLHTSQNNDISETPKNIEIQDFEPPKMVPAYVYIWKSQPPPHTHILGASGCEKRTLQKIRLRKWHQLQLKYNSERASKWS